MPAPAAARYLAPVCVQLSQRGSSPEPRRVWTGKTRGIDPILQVMTGWPRPARARPRPAAGRRRRGRLAFFEPSLRALGAGPVMSAGVCLGRMTWQIGRALEAWGLR